MRHLLFPVLCAVVGGFASFTHAQTTHNVTLTSQNVFDPADITIDVGDTVRWEWGGGFHNVESGDGTNGGAAFVHDGLFRSGEPTNTVGNTFEFTFNQSFVDANPMPGGVYRYVCIVHVDFGMIGSVTVNQSCTPDCTGRECGDDGCGGSCGSCDDGVGCTDDTCNAGTCLSSANNANCPDDNEFCNGNEFCDLTVGCMSTGTPCDANEICDGQNNQCVLLNAGIADADNDGIADALDNCPNVSNVGQADADNDGTGDACDATPNGNENSDDENPSNDDDTSSGDDDAMRPPSDPGTVFVGRFGMAMLEAFQRDTNVVATVEILSGTPDEEVAAVIFDAGDQPGLVGMSTLDGFLDEVALSATLDVWTSMQPGSFRAVVQMDVPMAELNRTGISAENAAIHVLTTDEEKFFWQPAGDKFVGMSEPTYFVGDYGYDVAGGIVSFWVIRDRFSVFAIGEVNPDGFEPIEEAPDDSSENNAPGMDDDANNMGSEPPAEQDVPMDPPTVAPCGTMGVLPMMTMMAGLVPLGHCMRRRRV